jgi:hypothetical protein
MISFSKQKNRSNCGRYWNSSPSFVYLQWHWKGKTTNIDTVNPIFVELEFWVVAWPRLQGVGFLGRSWWPYDARVHMDAEAITENMFSWTVALWRCHSCCLGILACRNSPPLYAHVNMEPYMLSLKYNCEFSRIVWITWYWFFSASLYYVRLWDWGLTLQFLNYLLILFICCCTTFVVAIIYTLVIQCRGPLWLINATILALGKLHDKHL